MGCGLCANVCTTNAISIVWSTEGFPVPSVDEERCIGCGLCVKKCIALETPPERHDDIDEVEAYGAWNRDADTHHYSSSGGVFSALSNSIFAKGGCVFGVVWQDKETAIFVKADNIEELAAMRGSKYTPAMPGYVYREVREELKSGRWVFFSGTPCQVHALKVFLNKDYENLVTMDIVCHGIPSHLILQKYIREDEVATQKEIKHVSFRDKPESWLNFSVTRHYTDGTQAYTNLRDDSYMRMFLCDAALNRVCYDCPYAIQPRQGDITVGDFWGVEKLHPEWPIRWGVSSVLINSPRGKWILELSQHALELNREPFRHMYEGHEVMYSRDKMLVHPKRLNSLAMLQDETSSLGDALELVSKYRVICGIRFKKKSLFVRTLNWLQGLRNKA